MSNVAISLTEVSKWYKRFKHPGWRAWDALGFPVFSKRYDLFKALHEINLEIKKGEKVALIGRNGAGKSTLLRLILGQTKANAGIVKVSGTLQALMELGTGFHPDFTGIENIRSALAYQGIHGNRAKKLIDEIIDFTELEDFITRPVREFSAGMYARLAFAVATTVSPDILIIDEILSAGDAYFIGKSIQRIKALSHHGTTLLFVSHDMSATQLICDRGLWLDQGIIQADGDILSVGKMYMSSIRDDEENRLQERSQNMHLAKMPSKTVEDKLLVNALSNNETLIVQAPSIDTQSLTKYDRYGHGPIKISAFCFLDEHHVERHTLISGKIAKARISYQASCSVSEPVAVVAIYRSDGTCVMQVLSNREGFTLKTLSGEGTIIVTFNPLFLGPGEYVVSVALFKELDLASRFEPQAYDLHDRCYPLKVLHPHGVGVEIGIVNQPASWELA